MEADLLLYIDTLEAEFRRNGDQQRAAWQTSYLKNLFPFIGLDSPKRREIQKPFLQKQYLPSKSELPFLIKELWKKPEREFQMFGLDLLDKYKKQFDLEDIELLEYTIVSKSWWDSVDFIATTLVGEYMKKYPEQIEPYTQKCIKSGNMWLQRTAIIFQMKYKDQLNTDLLVRLIPPLLGSREFFINKAIGWMLRQYSRTNPSWVIGYVENTPQLSNLSKREALRLIE